MALGLRVSPKLASAHPVVAGKGFNWYVDSVSGNDSNTGKSQAQAFATITKLLTVFAAGESAALKRGSEWREELTVPGANCEVAAYGSGARPILNAANVDLAGSWSKTAGRTNVYEVSITPEWYGSGKDYLNAFEDETFLDRVADEATCDSTPGSYFPSAATGTITLYIHPNGSTDPRSDGKTYEHTHRKYGLFSRSYSGCKITGIQTEKSLHNDGSLVVGSSSTIVNCLAKWGNSHNILVGTGCCVYSTSAEEGYQGTTNMEMFVVNEDSPSSEGFYFKDCSAIQSAFDTHATGFYCHRNVGGDFGTVTFEGCTVQNCNVGMNASHVTAVNVNNSTFTGTFTPFRFGGAPWTVDTATITGTVSRIFELLSAATVTASNLDIDVTGANVLAFYSTAAVTFTLTDSNIRITGHSGICRCVYLDNAGSTLDFQRNVFGDGWFNVYFLTNSPTLTSDYNCFDDENESFRYGAPSYATVALWQAEESQDLNSTVGGCAS